MEIQRGQGLTDDGRSSRRSLPSEDAMRPGRGCSRRSGPLGTERPGSQEENSWAEVHMAGIEGTTAEFGDARVVHSGRHQKAPPTPVPPEGLHLLINIAAGIASLRTPVCIDPAPTILHTPQTPSPPAPLESRNICLCSNAASPLQLA